MPKRKILVMTLLQDLELFILYVTNQIIHKLIFSSIIINYYFVIIILIFEIAS